MELPTERTIRTKLNLLGYHPSHRGESQTKKKIAETDAIFEQVSRANAAADACPHTRRLSMDAKATVKIGPFARGGKSRVVTKAADHDFRALETVTPVGLLLPATNELFVAGVTSAVPSDWLIDRLEAWWDSQQLRFRHISTLVLNLDNGPECHSRRTQFIQRLVDFVDRIGLTLQLAYYPPYHSKYGGGLRRLPSSGGGAEATDM